MNSTRDRDTPMSQTHQGPLHLQRFLQSADAAIEKALLKAVTHNITVTRGLGCDCKSSASMRAMPPEDETVNDEACRRAMETSRARIDLRRGLDGQTGRAMPACLIFYIKLNDEAGVYHAICRRCQRKVTVYDRDLYWGTPRKTAAPETFPYNCSCGGHAFEIALGFNYPDEALDENDIDTLAIAVRCATCEETAVIFDDEAT